MEPRRLRRHPSSRCLPFRAPQLLWPPCQNTPLSIFTCQFAAAPSERKDDFGVGGSVSSPGEGQGWEERRSTSTSPDNAWRLPEQAQHPAGTGPGVCDLCFLFLSAHTCSLKCRADGCRSLTTNPIPLPPRHHAALSSRRLIVSDTESPFWYLKAFAVMRISPDITPKPTCKAEFPRGKKRCSPPLPCHPPPTLGPSVSYSCLSAISSLTCSLFFPAGL